MIFRVNHVPSLPPERDLGNVLDLVDASNVAELIRPPREYNFAFATNVFAVAAVSGWHVNYLHTLIRAFANWTASTEDIGHVNEQQ